MLQFSSDLYNSLAFSRRHSLMCCWTTVVVVLVSNKLWWHKVRSIVQRLRNECTEVQHPHYCCIEVEHGLYVAVTQRFIIMHSSKVSKVGHPMRDSLGSSFLQCIRDQVSQQSVMSHNTKNICKFSHKHSSNEPSFDIGCVEQMFFEFFFCPTN